MLNKWECEELGCDATAVGTGGAIGLRAVGWHFIPGAPLKCPAHRPDGSEKRIPEIPCDKTGPCSACRAEEEADRLQYLVAQAVEISGIAFQKKYAERWDR